MVAGFFRGGLPGQAAAQGTARGCNPAAMVVIFGSIAFYAALTACVPSRNCPRWLIGIGDSLYDLLSLHQKHPRPALMFSRFSRFFLAVGSVALGLAAPSAVMAEGPAQGGLKGVPSPDQSLAADPAPSPDSGSAPDPAPASESLTQGTGSASPWAATVELYGFAPLRTTGTTTVRGFSADTDLGLGEILDKLQWASSARASVERNRWGLLVDLSYVKLGDSAAFSTAQGVFTGKAEVNLIQGIYDLAVRYRFGEREAAVGQPGQFSLIPYAGIRLLQADLNVKAQVEALGTPVFRKEGNVGRTWVQPLVGTQASLFLSPRLRAFARADVAGFGLSGEQDLSGNAQLGLGYAVGNNTDLNLSWRYLGIVYDNGAERENGYRLDQNGIELGVKFFF